MKNFLFLLPGFVMFASGMVIPGVVAASYPDSPVIRLAMALVAFVGMWAGIAINQRERRT